MKNMDTYNSLQYYTIDKPNSSKHISTKSYPQTINVVVVVVVVVVVFSLKNRSDLYSVPSNIRTGPADANAFRGHRLTTQKGYILWKKKKKRTQKSQHIRDNWKRTENTPEK